MTRKEMDGLCLFLEKSSDTLRRAIANEIRCRKKINSCIVHNKVKEFYDESTDRFGKYGQEFLDRYTIGELKQMLQEQQEEIARGE